MLTRCERTLHKIHEVTVGTLTKAVVNSTVLTNRIKSSSQSVGSSTDQATGSAGRHVTTLHPERQADCWYVCEGLQD